MCELRAIIPAAGRGSRSGLPYPKTLFRIGGRPILMRIVDLIAPFDRRPVIAVSPEGEGPIRECLREHGVVAEIVVQPSAVGMGDAVLRMVESPACAGVGNILLIWGDVPFIRPETVRELVTVHVAQGNDFTFVTRMAKSAYTVVRRDDLGQVVEVIETREEGVIAPVAGERDIGLFIFRKDVVADLLRLELPGKWGAVTDEHGFLYVIAHLVSRGFKVNALPIATEIETISLNRIQDIRKYL